MQESARDAPCFACPWSERTGGTLNPYAVILRSEAAAPED